MTKQNEVELETETKEEVEVETTETESQDDETTKDEVETKSDEESKQFETLLKREREAREKAEKALAEKSFKLREKKRIEKENDTDVDDEDYEEDKPMTAKEFEKALAREREKTRKEILSTEANRIASTLATSDTEKQCIIELYNNRSFPSHLSLEEQIRECYLIANQHKIIGQNNELKRALLGKKNVSSDSSTTHHDAIETRQPKISPASASEMARVGFKWNATSRQYEKKLPNGKTLVKDQATGKTYLL